MSSNEARPSMSYTIDGRVMTVHYAGAWKSCNKLDSRAAAVVFNDQRCAHVRELCVNDMNVHVANALPGLSNMDRLRVDHFNGVFNMELDALAPGIWSQLKCLTMKGPIGTNCDEEQSALCIADHAKLVAAAPNLRELHMGLACSLASLADILDGLKSLEHLTVHYISMVEAEGREGDGMDVPDYKHLLDDVTPAELKSIVLLEEPSCYSLDEQHYQVCPLAKLTEALVRMQGRSPHKFTIELDGTHIGA